MPWSSAWHLEALRVLDERTRISCLQSGSKGPPFYQGDATGSALGRLLVRWLPWNWYSIDGTGWCYDSTWDELTECSALRARSKTVDWNGVSTSPFDGIVDDVLLVNSWEAMIVLGLATAYAAGLAHRSWIRRDARRRADAEELDVEEEENEEIDEDGETAELESGVAKTNDGDLHGFVDALKMLGTWLRSGEALPWRWDRTAHLAVISALLGLLACQLVWLPNPTALDLLYDGDDTAAASAADSSLGADLT